MKTYMVFRMHSKEEMPDASITDRAVFYGWSNSKEVIKAFMSQRNQKKYKVVKMNEEDITEYFSEDRRDKSTKIDILVLTSVQNGDRVKLFTTCDEVIEAEKAIQRMFYDAATVIDHGGSNALELFINLRDRYSEALELIGFKPKELEAIFNPVECESYGSSLELIEDQIDGSYSIYNDSGTDEKQVQPDVSMLSQAYSKMLYSLEAFIKVLKEDL